MQFGSRVKEKRTARGYTQEQVAERMAVSVYYICKVQTGRLHFGDYPSVKYIRKLACDLNADEDEFLILADKVPTSMQQRIRQRSDAFRAFASLDDRAMGLLLRHGSEGTHRFADSREVVGTSLCYRHSTSEPPSNSPMKSDSITIDIALKQPANPLQ